MGFVANNNIWRPTNHPNKLFNKTKWLPNYYNVIPTKKRQIITYKQLTLKEQQLFPEGRMPLNGGSLVSEKEYFCHFFSNLTLDRINWIKEKI